MLIDPPDENSLDFTGWPRPALKGNDGAVRFAEGVTLADLSVAPSGDGHHLMISCRDTIVAVLSAMGGGPDRFHFADGLLLTAEELLERL